MMKKKMGIQRNTELADLADRLRKLVFALDELSSVGPDGIQGTVCITDWVAAKRTVPILVGRMAGHPTIKDGNIGATTEIFYIDEANGLARSLNRWYRLGRRCGNEAGLQ
ncbi:DUF6634 family protein [Agrobacterium sp.]|uniref:DUF6634 family protein n=1 Tax=Agrobacterium sp. TaxID=361 RepID=UPI0028AC6E83